MSSFSNGKRYSTRNAVRSAKRKAIDSELMATSNQMKITDLNPDCLEHILKYLHIKDLVNFADSRKSLKDAVDQAFTSKYEKRFFIELHESTSWNLTALVEIQLKNGRKETIHTLGYVMKSLRCFGNLVTALEINLCGATFKNHRNEATELRHYVGEYCSETLIELKISLFENGLMPVSKQFVNLEKLVVVGTWDNKLEDLNRFSPKLSCLHMLGIPLFSSRPLEVHIPHLKDFAMTGNVDIYTLKNCLRLNPQIEFLRISSMEDTDILNFVNKYHQLKMLDIHFEEIEEQLQDWIQDFINQHTSLDELRIRLYEEDFIKITKGVKGETEMLEIILPNTSGWRLSYHETFIKHIIELIRKNN